MTEMTTKRKEGIVKVAKTFRLTEPEYSSFGNMILLAVFHNPVYNFNIIFSVLMIERQHNDLKCLLGDFYNYCRLAHSNDLERLFRNSSFLILQFRTKDQRTSPGAYQKNFLRTRKVHLIYSLTRTTEFL